MRPALSLLLVVLLSVLPGLGLARVARAEDLPPTERAFVQLKIDHARPYVGQVFRVRLRFGLERAWFEAHAVPLFPQEMDLPVQIRAPWSDDVGGTRDPKLSVDSADGLRFVLADRSVRATPLPDAKRDGRTFAVFEYVRAFEPTRAGRIELRAPTLRFAYATAFEEDFVGGRIALDRTDVRVPGEAASIEVRPLPEAGRPASFRGAVGRFRVEASAMEISPNIGGGVLLELEVNGQGNLWTFDAPRFQLPEGLHVIGVTDVRRGDARIFDYQFSQPWQAVREIPALPFAWFDPAPPGAYQVAMTEPMPLSLHRTGTDGGRGSGGVDPDRIDPEGAVADTGTSKSLGLRMRNCLGMWLLATLVGLWARRRWARAHDHTSDAPLTAPDAGLRRARIDTATAAARAALGRADALDAFTEFLAAWLDVQPGAVVAPDLDVRLRSAGIPADLAGRSARVVERGTAARYGAPAADATPDAAPDETLLDALQEAFGSD